MTLSGLFCADVPLRNYSLTHSSSSMSSLVWCTWVSIMATAGCCACTSFDFDFTSSNSMRKFPRHRTSLHSSIISLSNANTSSFSTSNYGTFVPKNFRSQKYCRLYGVREYRQLQLQRVDYICQVLLIHEICLWSLSFVKVGICWCILVWLSAMHLRKVVERILCTPHCDFVHQNLLRSVSWASLITWLKRLQYPQFNWSSKLPTDNIPTFKSQVNIPRILIVTSSVFPKCCQCRVCLGLDCMMCMALGEIFWGQTCHRNNDIWACFVILR